MLKVLVSSRIEPGVPHVLVRVTGKYTSFFSFSLFFLLPYIFSPTVLIAGRIRCVMSLLSCAVASSLPRIMFGRDFSCCGHQITCSVCCSKLLTISFNSWIAILVPSMVYFHCGSEPLAITVLAAQQTCTDPCDPSTRPFESIPPPLSPSWSCPEDLRRHRNHCFANID